MQPSETLTILNSLLFTAAFCCGERWSVSGWLCTGNDWRGAGATTPALKLDADWIGLLGAGTLAGCSLAHRCLAISPIKSDGANVPHRYHRHRRDIGGDDVCLSPVELLVMRVLIGIVIGADFPSPLR